MFSFEQSVVLYFHVLMQTVAFFFKGIWSFHMDGENHLNACFLTSLFNLLRLLFSLCFLIMTENLKQTQKKHDLLEKSAARPVSFV